MSPIFVRPVREQLEHDRLIRYLQTRYKRKFEVGMNPGDEQTTPVKIGANTFFPDLVLTAGKKLAGLVEVESGESVNNLEAMAEWVHFSRVRVPFHLYVPVQVFDAARRLCAANNVKVAEIWTYRPAVDGFDLVRMFHDASAGPSMQADRNGKAAPAAKPIKPVAKPMPVAKPVPAAKPAPAAKPVPASKPAPAAKQAATRPGAKKPARPAKPAKKTSKPHNKKTGRSR